MGSQRFFRALILPSLFFALSVPAQATSRFTEARLCPAMLPVLAHRTGTESCWARYEGLLEQPARAPVCIPKRLWIEILQGALAGKTWLFGSGCLRVQGEWQIRSPLANERETPVKRVLRRFVLRAIPHPADPKKADQESWRAFPGLVALHVEGWRERSHVLLQKADRLGVLRRLLLNQADPENFSGFLQRLGFVHVVTAAGIHLYVLALLWDRALGLLLPFLGASRLRRPHRIIRAALVTGSWTLAWLLCGARAGMLRPWLLIVARSAAEGFGFRWRKWSPLMIALGVDGIVAITRPGHAPGRWIYALAVGGGLLARSIPSRHPHLLVAIGSWVFAALAEAWQTGCVALGTPWLNLITLPLFCYAVYPAALLGLILEPARPLAGLVAELASECIAWLTRAALALDTLWIIPRPALLAGAVLALVSIAATAFLKGKRAAPLERRALAFALLTALGLAALRGRLCSPARAHSAETAAETLEQLDVGQGDAALVRESSSRAGLIDTGSERALSDTGWLDLLASRGISRLDWVLLTHLDEDHAGGLERLSRLIAIDCVLASRAELESIRGIRLRQRLGKRGIRVESELKAGGCVRFPVRALSSLGGRGGKNDGMLAVVVSLPDGRSYLNAGDTDLKGEEEFLNWMRSDLGSILSAKVTRILKVTHHGSRFASGGRFLKGVAPTEAWVSAGAGNRFGHPTFPVLKRLEKLSIAVRRTDEQGRLSSSDPPKP